MSAKLHHLPARGDDRKTLAARYGVRGALGALDVASHIQVRQALIRTLCILVPAIYLPTLLLAIAGALLGATAGGTVFRGAAVLVLLIWIALMLGGTVPINAAVLDWTPSAPPAAVGRAKHPSWRGRPGKERAAGTSAAATGA